MVSSFAGFNAIKGRTGPDGQPLSDEALEKEASHIKDALSAIEGRISQAQQELAGMRNQDEQDVWETNLVILQVKPHNRCPLSQNHKKHTSLPLYSCLGFESDLMPSPKLLGASWLSSCSIQMPAGTTLQACHSQAILHRKYTCSFAELAIHLRLEKYTKLIHLALCQD